MLQHNAHSVTDLQFHVVFCLKYRWDLPADCIAEKIDAGLRTVSINLGVEVLSCAVERDHVHLQFQLPPDCSVSWLVGRLKRATSCLLPRHFNWSRGYYCSSVGIVDEYAVRSYIRNQGV